jgi:hypothetical protein
MNRWLLTGAAATALLTTCLPAHAVVLRCAPKVGEVHRYEVTAAGSFEMTIPGAEGQTGGRQTTAEVQCEQKVLSQTGEVTRLQTDLLGGKGTTTMDGEAEPVQVPTGRAVLELDRRARITKVVEVNLAGKDVSQRLGPWAEFLSNWSQFSAFPEGDAKVDDSWTATFTSRLPLGGERIEMSIKSQLLDLTSLQGRQCAKIRTTFSGPLKLEGSDMGPFGSVGPTTGNLQGDLTWYYDYENSVFVAGEGSAGMERSRFLQGLLGLGMPDGTFTDKMVMNVKVALVQ